MTSSTLTLVYRDVEGAASWLERVFRFRRENVLDSAASDDRQVFVRLNDMLVGLAAEMAPQKLVSPQSISLQTTAGCQVAVDDLDELYRHVVQQGATIVLEPQDEDGAEREFACRDLEGHVWVFVTKRTKSLAGTTAIGQPTPAVDARSPSRQARSTGSFVLSLVAAAIVAAIGSSALTAYTLRGNTERAEAAFAGRHAGGMIEQEAGQKDATARLAADLAPLKEVPPKLNALASELMELNGKVTQGFTLVDKLSVGRSGPGRDNDALISSVDELKRRLSAAESASAVAAQRIDDFGAGIGRQLMTVVQTLDVAARARTDTLINLDQKLSTIAEANDVEARKRNDALATVSQKLEELSSKLSRIPSPVPEDREAKPGRPPAAVAIAAAMGSSPPPSDGSKEPRSTLSESDLARACSMAIRQNESTEQELKQARLSLTKAVEEKSAAQRRERELQSTLEREIKSKQYAWKTAAESKRRVSCEPTEGNSAPKKKQADAVPQKTDGE